MLQINRSVSLKRCTVSHPVSKTFCFLFLDLIGIKWRVSLCTVSEKALLWTQHAHPPAQSDSEIPPSVCLKNFLEVDQKRKLEILCISWRSRAVDISFLFLRKKPKTAKDQNISFCNQSPLWRWIFSWLMLEDDDFSSVKGNAEELEKHISVIGYLHITEMFVLYWHLEQISTVTTVSVWEIMFFSWFPLPLQEEDTLHRTITFCLQKLIRSNRKVCF